MAEKYPDGDRFNDGNLIRLFRERHNLTQQRFADRLHVDVTLVEEVECGEKQIDDYLADKLNEWFFDMAGEKIPREFLTVSSDSDLHDLPGLCRDDYINGKKMLIRLLYITKS